MFRCSMLINLVLSILFVAGCSQQKYRSGEMAAGSLESAAKELTVDQGNIANTMTALNNLMGQSGGDLRPKYKAFNEALDKLTKSAQETQERANEMKSKGDAYFANWDKEAAAIKNEDIKARSEARKTDIKKQFQHVSDLYQQAKSEYVPFQNDLKDIRTALGIDLTPGGLNSVKDIVSRASIDGKKLQATVQQLSEEFRTLGMKMSPTGS